MIEDNVVCPFKAQLIGEEVEVPEFVWPEPVSASKCDALQRQNPSRRNHIARMGRPMPEGFEWIEAYLE